jgi:hypothetical protein
MSLYIEDFVPVVRYGGLNTLKAVDFSGAASCALPAGTTIGGSSIAALGVITSASATALAVGLNGATNPAFVVDSSTALQAAGLKITGASAAGIVAMAVISSGADASLTLNAKGAGTIGIGTASTGLTNIGRGSRKAVIAGATLTAIGAAQNSTPTAAQLLGGIISQVSQTGAGTVTLPIGSLLSTADTGVAVGDTFSCLLANIGNQTLTITGDTGSTVVGTAAVAPGLVAKMTFYNTGTNTWNVYCLVSA